MARTELEQFTADREQMRLFQQEYLILQVTERICELMEEQGLSRAELAKRLGTSKGYISQLLDGSANITLRKLADVMAALGLAAEFSTRKIECTVRPTMTLDVSDAHWRQPKFSIALPESIRKVDAA